MIGSAQRLGKFLGAEHLQRQASTGEALRLGQRDQVAIGAMSQAGAAVMYDEHHAMTLGEAEGQAAQRSFEQRSVHARP